MGTGTNAARAAEGGTNIHADAIDNMKDQLLICLLKKVAQQQGDKTVSISVHDIDATGDSIVMMHYDPDKLAFVFTLEKKQ